MSNFVEATLSLFKEHQRQEEDHDPLHIGEAMACWTYFTALAGADAFVEIAMNTTLDKELRRVLEDALKLCKSQTQRLQHFMQEEGIEIPSVQQEKVDTSPSSVPSGVKMTDDEIANGLSIKIAGALVSCAVAISQSIRLDLSAMWATFLDEELTFATSLKSIMRERGWLKRPPAFSPPGALPKPSYDRSST